SRRARSPRTSSPPAPACPRPSSGTSPISSASPCSSVNCGLVRRIHTRSAPVSNGCALLLSPLMSGVERPPTGGGHMRRDRQEERDLLHGPWPDEPPEPPSDHGAQDAGEDNSQ